MSSLNPPPPPKTKKHKSPSALKPTAYKIFVAERCAQTGILLTEGFKEFGQEWQRVPEEIKEQYKKRAKELLEVEKGERPNAEVDKRKQVDASKTLGYASSFIVSDTGTKRHSDDEKYYPEGKRYPKQENPPPSSESSCGSVAYCTSASISSSSTHFPDSDYDVWMEAEGEVYVNVNSEDDMPQQPDFNSEAKVITEQDSLGAIYQYYSTMEDIRSLDVFVISCVPVIYASGFKKAAVLPLNRPLELAMTTFSLREGRGTGFIHAFISPGTLPALTHADADECRLKRHGIPYAKDIAPDDQTVKEFYATCKVDEDYVGIYKKLLNFLGVRDFDKTQEYILPPVCCPQSELEVNSECLRWLHSKAEQAAEKRNLPITLPRLKFASLEAFAQIAVFHKYQSDSAVAIFSDEDALKKAFEAHKHYISLQSLNCRFHNLEVFTKACALGSVRASCFTVLAFLFTLYELPSDGRYLYSDGWWVGEKEMDSAVVMDES